MLAPSRRSDFAKRTLALPGYSGWTTFDSLRPGGGAKSVREGGTYVVLRTTDNAPRFLKINPAGHFKGMDQTVPISHLEANWVVGARVVYIGKADDLDERLRCMAAFGAGKRVAHRGGRLIWQLEEASDLLVAWRLVRRGFSPKTDEDDMIARFREAYGKPPFANCPDRMGR